MDNRVMLTDIYVMLTDIRAMLISQIYVQC